MKITECEKQMCLSEDFVDELKEWTELSSIVTPNDAALASWLLSQYSDEGQLHYATLSARMWKEEARQSRGCSDQFLIMLDNIMLSTASSFFDKAIAAETKAEYWEAKDANAALAYYKKAAQYWREAYTAC